MAPSACPVAIGYRAPCGVEQMVARVAHTHEAAGSSPAPATSAWLEHYRSSKALLTSMKTTYTFNGDMSITVERVYPDLDGPTGPPPMESMMADLVGAIKEASTKGKAPANVDQSNPDHA